MDNGEIMTMTGRLMLGMLIFLGVSANIARAADGTDIKPSVAGASLAGYVLSWHVLTNIDPAVRWR